jgi:peptide/nickel transport system permease protein
MVSIRRPSPPSLPGEGPAEDDPALAVGPEGGEVAVAPRGLWRPILDVFVQNRLATVGLGIVVLIALFCFLGPVFYHTNQVTTNLVAADQAPGAQHLLGTDDVGYDMLGRLMLGGQSSLEVGLAVAFIGTVIGTLWGAIAGDIGGVVDAVMMRAVDALLSLPGLVVLIILGAIFQPSEWLLILILSLLSWLVPARLVRGETLALRAREFVQASKAMGSTRRHTMVRHLMPNAVSVIVVNATFQIADAILILAALSFLGLGLPPPAATWGGILSNGLNYLYDGYWWQVYPVAILIIVTVVAFNFIGDALRDSFDVRLQRF